MNNENFLSVLNALGEVLKKNELTITCQQYEISELKDTINKIAQKIELLEKEVTN